MPQLVKKRRSGWAVLAAGALVASLLAVGSAPAGAEEIKTGDDNKAEPSEKATFSACVGDATADAGFTDTVGLGAEGAINCLAYYGITTGKTADTFDPGANVTRSQMALFLYRAAKAAGIDLMGGSGDADFGDIADQGEDRQSAIKALARNNILMGRGAMVFAPDAEITRAEMAVALVGFLRHGAPSLFHQSGATKGTLVIDSDDLDHFADARKAVPAPVDTAISYIYELGVTTGYPDATFRPNNPVPRKNMASFITRALAHTNLRPAGLSVQGVGGTLTVSIRDADFKAVNGEIVDAFYVSNEKASRAFNSNGGCRSVVTSVDMGKKCEIDNLDPATNADGNAQLAQLTAANIGKGVTVWVWTGDIGDKVGDGTDRVEFAQAPTTSAGKATKTTVSPSQLKTPQARFGSSVEFTAQLQYVDDRGTSGNTTDDLDKDTAIGADGENRAEYKLTVAVYTGKVDLVTAGSFAVASATGVVTANDSANDALGLVSRSSPETLKTDSEGKVTFSVTTGDPDPNTTGQYRTVVWILENSKNAPSAGTYVGQAVIFAEDASEATVVKATPINSYVEAPSSGSEGNGVVVTVLDQYHRPMRNQSVVLVSSDTTNSTTPGARSTSSNGTVRITYSHKGSAASVETLTAYGPETLKVMEENAAPTATTRACTAATGVSRTYTKGDAYADTADFDDDNDTTELVHDVVEAGKCTTTSIYWVTRYEDAMSDATNDNTVLDGSVDDDVVIVNDATAPTVSPVLVRYDSNDILQITQSGSTDYVDIDAFETALSKILDPDNDDTTTDDGVLTWDSYDHDDEDDRTLFTLSVS